MTPVKAEKATKVRSHTAQQFHSIVVEDTEKAILGDNGQIFTTGTEGKLVNGSLADGPPKDGIPTALGLAGVDTEAFANLKLLIVRYRRTTGEILLEKVQLTARVADEKVSLRLREPSNAGDLALLNKPLNRSIKQRLEISLETPLNKDANL